MIFIVHVSTKNPEKRTMLLVLTFIEENKWHIWQLSCESEEVEFKLAQAIPIVL
jgi:hypothetical protein